MKLAFAILRLCQPEDEARAEDDAFQGMGGKTAQ